MTTPKETQAALDAAVDALGDRDVDGSLGHWLAYFVESVEAELEKGLQELEAVIQARKEGGGW